MNIAPLGFLEQASLAHIAAAAQDSSLNLTDEQVRRLAATERACLSETCRVSFSRSAAARVIESFSSSGFLTGPTLDDTLADIIEAFYDLRADLPASVTDDEIVEALHDAFDDEAAGSVSVAQELAREQICQLQELPAYEIVDDDGNVYRWDPSDWPDDVQARGWNGECWHDEF